MTTVLKSLSHNCCFPEKINSKFLLVFCFEIHWSVCKCHSLEINVRGGGGNRNSLTWVPALAAIFSALMEMITKCLGIISVVSVHAGITDEVITALDLRDGQVFVKWPREKPEPQNTDWHHSLSEKCKSKSLWGTISRQSEWLQSKSLQAINAGEGVEKRGPSYTVGGNAN